VLSEGHPVNRLQGNSWKFYFPVFWRNEKEEKRSEKKLKMSVDTCPEHLHIQTSNGDCAEPRLS
jgi:hypothetical protein